MNDVNNKITHKVEPSQIKVGDLLAITYFVKVDQTERNGEHLVVRDLLSSNVGMINVQGKELITNSMSADYYKEEIKLSRTKIAEILISSFNQPLTVTFIKKDGTERVLRGRFISAETLLGRSYCEDLDIIGERKIREVDHRTIQSLIVGGVKYITKER